MEGPLKNSELKSSDPAKQPLSYSRVVAHSENITTVEEIHTYSLKQLSSFIEVEEPVAMDSSNTSKSCQYWVVSGSISGSTSTFYGNTTCEIKQSSLLHLHSSQSSLLHLHSSKGLSNLREAYYRPIGYDL
uniref:Uncharacterized protein n=1 Tax=Lactuca sativa TaxID=4236 RepID=A0A9R1XHD2_LACSA|nr:hypothetical protein LSAT_V11C400215010 [Lactuca sativa]